MTKSMLVHLQTFRLLVKQRSLVTCRFTTCRKTVDGNYKSADNVAIFH